MQIIINGEEYLGLNEVLKLLKLKKHRLYEKIKNNELSSPFKPDERALWKKSEIELYLSNIKEK